MSGSIICFTGFALLFPAAVMTFSAGAVVKLVDTFRTLVLAGDTVRAVVGATDPFRAAAVDVIDPDKGVVADTAAIVVGDTAAEVVDAVTSNIRPKTFINFILSICTKSLTC